MPDSHLLAICGVDMGLLRRVFGDVGEWIWVTALEMRRVFGVFDEWICGFGRSFVALDRSVALFTA